MKKIISWITVVALALVFCVNPAHARMGQIEQPKSNFILFTHLAQEDSSLGPFLIVLKTSDTQTDVSFFNDGLFGFSVDRDFFDQATAYLQQRKNTEASCKFPASDQTGFGNFEIHWNVDSGNASLCVGLNDAIATFEDLNRLSASSSNKPLTEFLGVELGSLNGRRNKLATDKPY